MPKQVKTDSNIPVKPVYDSKVKPRSRNEQPGKFPYTRAIHKGMYRDRL
ncbi:MAG TPA: methylmalonyl-CoA mutase family protein, partial [Nitrosopumilaceae archaeon]|nr:methylmalonyl-CoA mutase family protein [Nitrosopumilaceae archaeon]